MYWLISPWTTSRFNLTPLQELLMAGEMLLLALAAMGIFWLLLRLR